ncbi:MAG TPA: sugar phosphate nucleotidyltransferase, partial [Armatimonadota bacterium]|nr:sugar phosphate nucleotidyltransferase [Armatimonadota bacterium]
GIRKVGLIVDPDADVLRRHVGDGTQFGLDVGWAVQDEAKGIAHALLAAEDLVADQPFLVYLGDALYGDCITNFVEQFAASYPAGLVRLAAVDDPRQYGVATLNGDSMITKLVEKPKDPPSNLAITGLYGFPPNFYDAIRETTPSARGELEITDAISNFLSNPYGVCGETYEGFWADAGQPHHLLDASRSMLDAIKQPVSAGALIETDVIGSLSVGEGSVLERCQVRGPVLVGRDCRITNSTIGPHVSIGDGCVIESTAVRDSILDQDATLCDVNAELEQCIVGIGSRVCHVANGAGPLSTVVGDGAILQTI